MVIVWVAQAKHIDDEFPEIKVFYTEDLAREQMVKWVNLLRKEAKLKPFKLSSYDAAMKWFEGGAMKIFNLRDGEFYKYEDYELIKGW